MAFHILGHHTWKKWAQERKNYDLVSCAEFNHLEQFILFVSMTIAATPCKEVSASRPYLQYNRTLISSHYFLTILINLWDSFPLDKMHTVAGVNEVISYVIFFMIFAF